MAEDTPTFGRADSQLTLTQRVAVMSPQQKIGLMVGIAALVALLAGMWMWAQTPDYRVLYSNLSDRDGGAIIDVLQQQNIPYKFSEGGGALLVPANQVHEIRLRLASQGLPKGSLAGFELMENQKFGTSQFLEQVNYQRALEGELARSMQTLAAVQAARVHLALPKPTVFVKEQQKPSASVVLTLYPGRTLDAGQINGIVHLISSSVPDMPAKNVTVLDQSGSLLNAPKEGSGPMDANQLKYVRQVEQDYVKRIEEILAPLVGPNNVHAQITADIDFSQAEQTAETYKPNLDPKDASLRSQQNIESSTGGQQTPSGVPGALSNQPPVPATATIASPASAVAATSAMTPGSSRHKESTANYEVDRTIRYTKLPVGSIKRISAAVVVNNRSVTDKNGKVSSKPLSENEKTQITALVKEAIGFDANRGDTLNVLNSAFNEIKEPPVAELPLWKQPEMIALAKDILKYLTIAGIGLYLLLRVIRPAVKAIQPPPPPPMPSLAPDDAAAAADAAERLRTQKAMQNFESNLQDVKKLAKDDPMVVASVLKEWVQK